MTASEIVAQSTAMLGKRETNVQLTAVWIIQARLAAHSSMPAADISNSLMSFKHLELHPGEVGMNILT